MAQREKPGGAATPPPARDLAGLGLQYVATLLLFLFGGRWLDGRLGTEPVLTLVGVFLGFVLGTLYIYRRLVIDPREGR